MQDKIDTKAKMELTFESLYKLQNHVIAMERAERECHFKDLNLDNFDSE